MKITKQEVKTIYEIEVTFEDYRDALEAYSKSEIAKAVHKDAFQFLDTKDFEKNKLADIRKYFESFHSKDEVATKRYIVEYLGFDGIENFGLYVDKTKTIHMIVFNYGDQINR